MVSEENKVPRTVWSYEGDRVRQLQTKIKQYEVMKMKTVCFSLLVWTLKQKKQKKKKKIKSVNQDFSHLFKMSSPKLHTAPLKAFSYLLANSFIH